MRVMYFYLMGADENRIRGVAPEHARYWRGLDLPGYMGGPFGDRSGGLIVFDADSLNQADELVRNDPFVQNGLLASRWTKAWAVE